MQNFIQNLPLSFLLTQIQRVLCGSQLAKPLIKTYAPSHNDQYRATLLYLFNNAQKREQWYAALLYARSFKKYITAENVDLYIELVRIGQWWDIIDEVAPHLIGKALHNHAVLEQHLTQWIIDDNFWVRRVALLTQLQYKTALNFELLQQLILTVAHEKEFFIRKAIGWVLREYSKTDAQAVVNFVHKHAATLSPLSKREALRLAIKKEHPKKKSAIL
jgi:3-methyladenine DNA glycosylase AlkD